MCEDEAADTCCRPHLVHGAGKELKAPIAAVEGELGVGVRGEVVGEGVAHRAPQRAHRHLAAELLQLVELAREACEAAEEQPDDPCRLG